MKPLKLLQSHFENAPFSPKDINRLGITPAQLIQLLEKESVHRLSRGVYVLAGADLSDEALFRAASFRIEGPSAVCLISALAFYGLTDHMLIRLTPESDSDDPCRHGAAELSKDNA